MIDLSSLLDQTSRTFALAIPQLPEPVRRQVTVAYLILRIADTLEDAAIWPRERRIDALYGLSLALRHADLQAARQLSRDWMRIPPTTHSGYLNLLAAFPELLIANAELADSARDIIHHHTFKTIAAMMSYVNRIDVCGELRLIDLADLRLYCYAVAGLVGEMLTELFLVAGPCSAAITDRLRTHAASFGEGLQLVNILKDAQADEREKRFLLPPEIPFHELIALARADLLIAQQYIDDLRAGGAPKGVIRFTAMPVLLAEATLAGIAAHGSGTKISRAEVARIDHHIHNAVTSDVPIWSFVGGTP